jgi:hypothetical protein
VSRAIKCERDAAADRLSRETEAAELDAELRLFNELDRRFRLTAREQELADQVVAAFAKWDEEPSE